MVRIQSVAPAKEKGDNTKHLQIKKKYGGIYPAMGKIFQLGVLDRFVLMVHWD